MKYLHLGVLAAVMLAACFVGIESKSCSRPSDCGDNSLCPNGFCECQYGFVWTATEKCLITSPGIGGGCEDPAQCRHLGPNVICDKNSCVCHPEYYHDQASNTCLRKKNIGEACVLAKECLDKIKDVPMSCTGQRCSCPDTHWPDASNTECNRKRKLGESCTEKKECYYVEGSEAKPECQGNVCSCPENFHANDDKNKCNSGVRNTLSILSVVIFTAIAKMMS